MINDLLVVSFVVNFLFMMRIYNIATIMVNRFNSLFVFNCCVDSRKKNMFILNPNVQTRAGKW